MKIYASLIDWGEVDGGLLTPLAERLLVLPVAGVELNA
jgi:hypothetical protein